MTPAERFEEIYDSHKVYICKTEKCDICFLIKYVCEMQKDLAELIDGFEFIRSECGVCDVCGSCKEYRWKDET